MEKYFDKPVISTGVWQQKMRGAFKTDSVSARVLLREYEREGLVVRKPNSSKIFIRF